MGGKNLDSADLAGVVLFSVEGVGQAELERLLRNDFAVHTKYRKAGRLEGIRVSPGIYMNEGDLDHFCECLSEAIKRLRQ